VLTASQLYRDTEKAFDELILPRRIPPVQPFDLTLPHHVQGFDTFNSAFRRVEGAKALTCQPSPPDSFVVLFEHIVEVRHSFRCGRLKEDLRCFTKMNLGG
jgi:hypothetical protein